MGIDSRLAGSPPLLDPHYKLEADSKFCALHALAINHARQRLDAFFWSSDQRMLPRSAVPVSHDARASKTHIFSDRPLNKLRFVQAQKLYGHCPRSALFISASRYMHLALAPRRYQNQTSPELRPNQGQREFIFSFFTGKPTTPLSIRLCENTVGEQHEYRRDRAT